MAAFWAGGIIFVITGDVTALNRVYLFGLLAAFALLLVVGLRARTPLKGIYVILGLQVLILLAGAVVLPTINILIVAMSILAISRLPTSHGMIWTAFITLINLGIQYYEGGFPTGVVDGFINGLILFAIAAFARSLLQADQARREAQQLLTELTAAHTQLQEYAAQVEEFAVAEERNRLSRDLHDTLGHRLTVSIVQLEGAERLISTSPEKAGQMVETVRQQLIEGLSEVRRTVAMLRTPIATDLSLPKALHELASDFEKATQLAIKVTVPDSLPPLPEAYRLALYRAAQESLTNIQRHAQASQASLTMDLSAEALTLRVEDNGVGLSDGADQQGFGLRGMRERITQLGGTVEMHSADADGTTVLIQLPNTIEENP
jgi:signal transduction histidine kinase